MTEGGSGTGLEPTKIVTEDKEKGESEPTKTVTENKEKRENKEEYPGVKQDKDREETWKIIEHNSDKNNNKTTNMVMNTEYCQTITEEDIGYTATWIFDNMEKTTETEIREKLEKEGAKVIST